ncbi:Nin one binding Zn-ribbon like-domain-containing protein [Lophiotrema nucula]|uniref:20S-pre-rRNA D-site endonuclease NOB1 n=1 Tax=Lophiotrema nucula TaxID=690887 RepID=A0A6A5Z403_9PLEO|nr:Nin one binding Zn-ribbon like-domain-containing protein [Lophiotrema nucula]
MAAQPQKPFHSLIVDTGPLIKNTISISSMVSQSEEIFTTPAILSELRDAATRSRVETTLMPFLKVRTPTQKSYERVVEFSKKTGDFPVLSKQDLGILALAYEVECEREGGDWRLRKVPGEKLGDRLPPKKHNEQASGEQKDASEGEQQQSGDQSHSQEEVAPPLIQPVVPSMSDDGTTDNRQEEATSIPEIITEGLSNLEVSAPSPQEDPASSDPDDDDDDGEWITPGNLAQHQVKHSGISTKEAAPVQISVATLTTDYAMQNVLLQMNLHLLSPALQRISTLRSYILRCHACFLTTKDMSKEFCPRCGQPALNRVSCSTNANGEFKIHLSKNHQWNNRGNKYSVPKPVHGTPNGKHSGKGGGKGGWGRDLVLAEDQKEYVRATAQEKRTKTRDLMDEDYLPNILSGDRGRAGGRPKVGAGKNVNARKRF